MKDIFSFWREIDSAEKIHPRDRDVLSRVKHRFDLRCLPGCFMGPLRTASVVLLYLSPGFSPFDLVHATSSNGQALEKKRRQGHQPLPGPEDHLSAWRWWSSRTKGFGNWTDIQTKVAVLNIGAYHSKTFADAPLLSALPSSRASLEWAQSVLFPQAISGKRIVICMRASRFWGLDGDWRHGHSLFAPPVTRSGYMLKGPKRRTIEEAVRTVI